MEQEQILETLNSQLGQTSLSERTIREYVAENLPAEGEEFNFERHAKILKSLSGNFNADVAKTVEEFKKNYSSKTSNNGEKREEKSNNEDKIPDILKRIEELEKASLESSRLDHEISLRKAVDDMKDSLKVHNKNLWKDCVKDISIEKDDTKETVLKKAKESYEKKLKDYFGDGTAPYGGKSIEQSEAEKEKVKNAQNDFKARMKARGRL